MLPPIRQGMTALHGNKLDVSSGGHVARQLVLLLDEKNVQDGELAPQVCEAIESAWVFVVPGHHNFRSAISLTEGIRTTGRGGVVLDSSALAVELVVDDPRGLSLGAVEAALGGSTSLLRGTLREAGNVASEHGGCGRGYAWGGGERFGALVVR